MSHLRVSPPRNLQMLGPLEKISKLIRRSAITLSASLETPPSPSPEQNRPYGYNSYDQTFLCSRILIGGSISCDIMYYKLFENMGFDKINSLSYGGSYLQAFTL